MTKGQCRTAISQNQQNINQYSAQIRQLQKDIEELQRAKGKICELQSSLATCKGTSAARLKSTVGLNNVSHKIVSGFYDGMNDILTGQPYTKVDNGLGTAITKIVDEIARKQSQISGLQSNIDHCNAQIDNMNREISRIETEEARKKAAEKAKNKTKRKK